MSHADAHAGRHSHRMPLIRPMRSRDPGEVHRAATPLELLFDLCFVVAVSQAAAKLHHGLGEGHVGHAIGFFSMVFFAIWWAWMNFTWFASAYDSDDVPYRVGVLVQMAGVLVLAAGVPRAFDGNFAVVTLGYAIMRVSLIALWLRAARDDAERRSVARRYALGIVACEVGWIGLLALPAGGWLYGFAFLVVAELAVPLLAERNTNTTWHPHHIAERYGCFTLLVLGESVLSATVAIQTVLDEGHLSFAIASTSLGGLLVFFSIWWLYFDQPVHQMLVDKPAAFRWGYGHLVVFASLAAVGAGLSVTIDAATGHGELSSLGAGATVAVPVSVFLLATWLLIVGPDHRSRLAAPAFIGATVLVCLAAASPLPVLTIGLILTGLVIFTVTAFPASRGHSHG
jgi:low temperature requirement protein LtrA